MVVWSGYGDSYRNILHVCYLFIDVRLFITPRPSKGLEYCDERVCLSVCLSVREHISNIKCQNFTKKIQHAACGLSSFIGVAIRYARFYG